MAAIITTQFSEPGKRPFWTTKVLPSLHSAPFGWDLMGPWIGRAILTWTRIWPVDLPFICSALHPKAAAYGYSLRVATPGTLSSHCCIVQTSCLSGQRAKSAHDLYNASRRDGEGGHWILRPRTRVWPMHSATRLVPLSNTGVPVTETVVDGTRTEAVYKITARIPTSAPSPLSPRRVNHSLTISSKPSAALRTAGVRTDEDGRGPIYETRPLR